MTFLILWIGLAGVFDWPGFHGLEHQGKSPDLRGPTAWSSNENIAWRTVIPGEGYSSPIVVGGDVYVTTAYEAPVGSRIRRLLDWGTWLGACLLALLVASRASGTLKAFSGRRRAVWLAYAIAFTLVVLVVVSVELALFGRAALDLSHSRDRGFRVGVIALLACLGASVLQAQPRSRWFLALGATSTLCSGLVALSAMESGGGSAYLMRPVSLVLVGLPIAIGVCLIVIHWGVRRRAEVVAGPLGPDVRLFGILVVAIGTLLGTAVVLGYAFRVGDYSLEYLRIEPTVGWVAAVIPFILAYLGVFWPGVPQGVSGRVEAFQWLAFSLGALFLGVGFLASQNPVLVEDRWTRAIVSLDGATGKIQWFAEGLEGPADVVTPLNTQATPTPVAVGDRIVAYFGSAGVLCADRKGTVLWESTGSSFWSQYGAGSSPVSCDGLVVVVSDTAGPEEGGRGTVPHVLALDSVSGKIVWRAERPYSREGHASHASPLVVTRDGVRHAIVRGWLDVRSYVAATGAELWRCPLEYRGRHLVVSPIADDRFLYVMDAQEVVALRLDLLAAGSPKPVAWSASVRGEKASTPVVSEGLLFLVTELGRGYCIDCETGSVQWEKRLPGRYFASVVVVGGRVYFTNEGGVTTVVAADREFRELATNDVGERIYASPAPVSGGVILRDRDAVYRVGR